MNSLSTISAVYIFTTVFTALFLCGLAVFTWPQRRKPDAYTFSMWLIGTALWIVTTIMSYLSPTETMTMFWLQASYIIEGLNPLVWLIFCIALVGDLSWVTPRRFALLSVIPLAHPILAFTNQWHGLTWRSIGFEAYGHLLVPAHIVHGNFYWVWALYSLIISFISCALLLKQIRSSQLYRRQVSALVFITGAPIVLIILQRLILPDVVLDLYSIGLTASAAATVYAVIHLHLFKLEPIPHDQLVSSMYEGMIVIDENQRITEINLAAYQMLDIKPGSEMVGHRINSYLPYWVDVFSRFQEQDHLETEVSIPRQETTHHYRLTLSRLQNRQGILTGCLIMIGDISEQKQLEQALVTSEQNYRLVVESASDGILIVQDSVIRYTNQRLSELLGTSPEDLVGKNYLDFVPPDRREMVGSYYQRRLSREEVPRIYEMEMVTSGGLVLPVEVNADIITYENAPAVLAIIRDISKRIETENTLRNNLEFLETLLDTIPSPVFYTDRDGIYQGCNRHYADDILGLPKEQIIGLSILQIGENFSTDTARHLHQRNIDLIREGGIQVVDECLPVAVGGVRDYVAYKAAYNDAAGQVAGLVGVLMDITERKQGEAALQRRLDFERILASISSHFLNLSQDRFDDGLKQTLETLCGFLGVDAAAIYRSSDDRRYSIQTHAWSIDQEATSIIVSQGMNLKDYPSLLEIYQNPRILKVDSTASLPDGSPLKELQELRGIKSGISVPLKTRGEFYGYISFDSLIKEKHWSDEDIRMLQVIADTLMGAIRRHSMEQQMLDTRDEAQSANRAKSAFLANMSHELRTPLNAIIGYSEMLEEDAEEFGYEDMAPDLKKINIAGHHLLDMINQVLDLAKIESGKMVLELGNLDIYEQISNMSTTMLPLVTKNGNTLKVECEQDIGLMYADEVRIRQVLLNLLSNAAKFTKQGHITLKAKRQLEDGRVCVHFSVIDSGIGITGEQMQRIFHAFEQADLSIGRKFGGTGLGLSISLQICRLMGGDLRAESEPGVGSKFVAVVPARVELPGREQG